MTWFCEQYGKNILRIAHCLEYCEKCHLKDACVRDSIKSDTELPFFLTQDEAMMIAEMFDAHPSNIASKLSQQTLYYASNINLSKQNTNQREETS